MTYLTDSQIAERWGVHRTFPWRQAKKLPEFPQPVKLSEGVTRWKLTPLICSPSVLTNWTALMAPTKSLVSAMLMTEREL